MMVECVFEIQLLESIQLRYSIIVKGFENYKFFVLQIKEILGPKLLSFLEDIELGGETW